MAKLIEITGKVLSGEWGTDDESGQVLEKRKQLLKFDEYIYY